MKYMDESLKGLDPIHCTVCYELFYPKRKWGICCSKKCQDTRTQILRRWKNKYDKMHGVNQPRKRKKKKILSIAEVNQLARAAGMDYGTYLAKTEGGMR